MFDLVNAQAEYQTQLKLFLKPSSADNIDDVLRLYLEKNKELECYKIGRFINLDTNTSMYCEWLFQYFKMQQSYDQVFELFTTSQVKEVEKASNALIREYNRDFYTNIWPKICLAFLSNLNNLKEEILKKYPFHTSALNSINNYVSQYQVHKILGNYKQYPKLSYLQNGKNSLSYLKIGFPLYLGLRQDVLQNPKILKPENVNWVEINEYLQTMCLIHNINNDDDISTKLALGDKNPHQRYEAIMNNFRPSQEEKDSLTSSLFEKCRTDINSLVLLDKHKTILDNILRWCKDFKDSKYN
ncbi:MAG: hypothetical protein ACRCXZ_05565 [Patescibacteria group bacterium]